MEKENNIYKGNAGNARKVNTNAHFEELKMIYQMALKAEVISLEQYRKHEAELQEIETAVPQTVIEDWQQEVEAEEASGVSARVERRQELIEDALHNGGAVAY